MGASKWRRLCIPVLVMLTLLSGALVTSPRTHAAPVTVAPTLKSLIAAAPVTTLKVTTAGQPAGTQVKIVHEPASLCQQPTATTLAEALAGKLTPAQLQLYGYADPAEFHGRTAFWQKLVKAVKFHQCTLYSPIHPVVTPRLNVPAHLPGPKAAFDESCAYNTAGCWGGSVMQASSYDASFTFTGSDWNIPADHDSTGAHDDYASTSTWVGMGGIAGDAGVLQTGTLNLVTASFLGAYATNYEAFIEDNVSPTDDTQATFNLNGVGIGNIEQPGDYVEGYVTNTWEYLIEDFTTGASSSGTWYGDGFGNDSLDCVDEDFIGTTLRVLAIGHYFNDCFADNYSHGAEVDAGDAVHHTMYYETITNIGGSVNLDWPNAPADPDSEGMFYEFSRYTS